MRTKSAIVFACGLARPAVQGQLSSNSHRPRPRVAGRSAPGGGGDGGAPIPFDNVTDSIRSFTERRRTGTAIPGSASERLIVDHPDRFSENTFLIHRSEPDT